MSTLWVKRCTSHQVNTSLSITMGSDFATAGATETVWRLSVGVKGQDVCCVKRMYIRAMAFCQVSVWMVARDTPTHRLDACPFR